MSSEKQKTPFFRPVNTEDPIQTNGVSDEGADPQERRRVARKGVPADVVFYIVAGICIVAMAVVFFVGHSLVGISAGVVGALIAIWALYENDRHGFNRSSEMRRAFEPRRRFNAFEVMVLVGLLMGIALVMTYVLVTQ